MRSSRIIRSPRWAWIVVAIWLATATASATPSRDVSSAYWTAGGRLISFWDGRQLWIVKADGTHRRPVAEYSVDGVGAASVSPSGRMVAVSGSTSADRGVVVLKRPAGKRIIRRFRLGTARERTDGLGEPAWAPDERALAVQAYMYGRTEREQIFVADLQNGVRSVSPFGSRDDELPAWSPDGRRIAFFTCRDDTLKCDLAVIAPDGSHRRALVRQFEPMTIFDAAKPAWAPNGISIALVARFEHQKAPDQRQRYGIYTVGRDGTKFRRVATTAVIGASWVPIAWSPDGRQLAFSDEGGLWAIDLRTRRKRLLTALGRNREGWRNGNVSWAPSPRILFTYRGDIYTMLPGTRPARILG